MRFIYFILDITSHVLSKLEYRWECLVALFITTTMLARWLKSDSRNYKEKKLYAIIEGAFECLKDKNVELETLMAWVSTKFIK